jgi:restriction system protein
MAEITRRRSGELLRGVAGILLPFPDGLPAREVLANLEHVVPPTPFEQSEYPNRPGVRRYEKIVRFQSINVVKAGWLIKGKGVWTLTDEGRAAYEKFQDPEEFFRAANALYHLWAKDQPAREADDEAAPAEGAATTLEEAEEAAWASIYEYVSTMNPYDFQKIVAALLKAMDYHVGWIAPPGPDRGIDIVAHTDPLGAAGPRIKVQVKRRGDKVGAPEVRSFMAVLGDQDVGIFVSVGGFTSDAEMEVRTQERRRLTLMDLERLFDLWVQHWGALDETERRLLPIKPIYFLSPVE